MKVKAIFGSILVLLALAVSVSAADIAGKWTAQAAGVELTLVFKVDGTTLTGTVNNPQAGETDIKEGKIEGDDISFYLQRKIGETDMKIVWKGKVSGPDEIKFTREIAGGAGGPATEVIAKRIK
jgi:hypothetical protein